MANNQFKLVPVDYSKPYDEQPDCKRHVIGAYANLARHNMTLTINVIMQAIGMPLIDDENKIDNAFSSGQRDRIYALDNIQKVNLQKRLYRHFPFFKRMKLEDETKKSVQLDELLKVMSDFTSCMAMLRNYYTHYYPYNSPEEQKKQFELKKKMGQRLQYLYENTCQMFKSNEALDHESNEVLSALRIPEDYIEETTPKDKDYKKLYDFWKNNPVKFKKQGNKLNQKTGVITRKKVKYVRNPEYQAYMMDDKNGMSDVAIVFFLCLFLDKKVSFELMDDVGFTAQIKFEEKIKDPDHAERQILYLKEIMCMNRIRMTKTKLDSEMTDTALALDMLNEVRKCPKPLYEVLGKKARDEFKDETTVQWESVHGKEAVVAEEIMTEDETESTTEKNTPRSTFVRWDDRFPQLALNYIDYQVLFDDIRFQLNLGQYRFSFYQHDKKQSIDNEERLRILQKELHGFGRIQEVESELKNRWKDVFDKKYKEDGLVKKEPDKAGQAPYVTEQKPQYAIDERSHSIGLRWEGWDNGCQRSSNGELRRHHLDGEFGLDRKKMFIPYLPLKPQDEEKQTNQAEPLLPPQAMMNLYELPALLFYQYLLEEYNGGVENAENIIKDTYKQFTKFFKDVNDDVLKPVNGKDEKEKRENLATLLSKYQLQLSDIPEKLLNYLCAKDIDYDKKMENSAKNRLDERKKRVEKSLSSYKEKKKVIGTKENKFDRMRATIKTCQLAGWLIRDIMDWIPNKSTARARLTGQNYASLQATMALFGQQTGNNKRDNLERCFRNAQLMAKEGEQFKKDIHHPFLEDVVSRMQDETLESFYEKYLECELTHIAKVKKIIETGGTFEIYYSVPFLHCDRERWSNSGRSLAAKYLKRPIQLPNGLFTKPIFDFLWKIENQNLHKALEKSHLIKDDNSPLSNNVAYLMRLYFKFVEHDHPQPFYNTSAIDGNPSPYLHIYRFFKKLYGQLIQRSNRTTTPAYTIEEIRDKRKQAKCDIASYVEKKIDEWQKHQQNEFEQKLRKKLKKENEKQLNINEEVLKAVQQETSSTRTEMTSKMEKQLRKVYDNERTIRRFKTQDMMLFVMARNILKAKSNDKDFTQGFCLKNVMSESLLDKTIDFGWKVNINGKSKIIEQKDMKIKNYGQFYKFASDHQRLESLLSRLPDNLFKRAEIENELSYYDTNLSEVFRQVYIIESEAYKLKPEFLNDDNADKEWFYYTYRGRQHPKRNNFLSLLEILAAGNDGILDDKEKIVMQRTRNAFGHNTYDVDFDVIFEGREERKKIPEVANGISEKIKDGTKELKKKLEK